MGAGSSGYWFCFGHHYHRNCVVSPRLFAPLDAVFLIGIEDSLLTLLNLFWFAVIAFRFIVTFVCCCPAFSGLALFFPNMSTPLCYWLNKGLLLCGYLGIKARILIGVADVHRQSCGCYQLCDAVVDEPVWVGRFLHTVFETRARKERE